MSKSNGNPCPDVKVKLIFNDGRYKEYAAKNDIPTPNGLSDENFSLIAERFGKSYDLIEFEMFWNTGEIPAFCYIRFIKKVL